MHYIKYPYTQNNIDGFIYAEVDKKCALRQVGQWGDVYEASNLTSAGAWSSCLADQEIDINADDFIPITKEEFETVWIASNRIHQARWNAIKQHYPIGMQVSGMIKIFYPQGVIVQLDDAVGVTNYAALEKKNDGNSLYTNVLVHGHVTGYDEVNLWLLVGDAHL